LKGHGPSGVIRNIFHYVPDSTPLNLNDAAAALATEFASAAFLTPWSSLIHSNYTWDEVRVTDLADTEVLKDLAISVGGSGGGDQDASQLTVTFESEQPAVGVHRARKGYGPVGEGVFLAGAVDPTLTTTLNGIATALDTPLVTTSEQGFDGSWQLVVVKRIRVGSSPPYTYRLPGPADFEATAYPAVGWAWNTHPGTQNSRKFGRGE
jgi:hypothetical protein